MLIFLSNMYFIFNKRTYKPCGKKTPLYNIHFLKTKHDYITCMFDIVIRWSGLIK